MRFVSVDLLRRRSRATGEQQDATAQSTHICDVYCHHGRDRPVGMIAVRRTRADRTPSSSDEGGHQPIGARHGGPLSLVHERAPDA